MELFSREHYFIDYDKIPEAISEQRAWEERHRTLCDQTDLKAAQASNRSQAEVASTGKNFILQALGRALPKLL